MEIARLTLQQTPSALVSFSCGFLAAISENALTLLAYSSDAISTSTSAAAHSPIGGAGAGAAQRPKQVVDEETRAVVGDAAAGQASVTLVKRWQVAFDEPAKSLWTKWPVAHRWPQNAISGDLCQYLSNTHEIVIWSWCVMQM